jgi:hypothetical protein
MRHDRNPRVPAQAADPRVTRRTVFAGAGVAAAAATVATIWPASPQAAPEVAAAPGAPADTEHGRYQATPHVLHYYRTARV